MLIASSKAMLDVISLAEKASRFPVNVLILGETGCGKELIARHIHETSECDSKFLGINLRLFKLIQSNVRNLKLGKFDGIPSKLVIRPFLTVKVSTLLEILLISVTF